MIKKLIFPFQFRIHKYGKHNCDYKIETILKMGVSTKNVNVDFNLTYTSAICHQSHGYKDNMGRLKDKYNHQTNNSPYKIENQ